MKAFGSQTLKNSPDVPQNGCFRLASLSSGKVQSVGRKWQFVEEIWENYENIIFKGINRYGPHKTVSKNPDNECYNKEVKWLR